METDLSPNAQGNAYLHAGGIAYPFIKKFVFLRYEMQHQDAAGS